LYITIWKPSAFNNYWLFSVLYCKKLTVRQTRSGGYGAPTSTAATTGFSSFYATDGGGVGQRFVAELPQEVKTRVEENFFFMHNNRIVRATRNNFLNLYPANLRPDIINHISTNNTDFSNLDDLIAIIQRFNRRLSLDWSGKVKLSSANVRLMNSGNPCLIFLHKLDMFCSQSNTRF